MLLHIGMHWTVVVVVMVGTSWHGAYVSLEEDDYRGCKFKRACNQTCKVANDVVSLDFFFYDFDLL
jgi:hypothetical protein